jgi:hypothetical protein
VLSSATDRQLFKYFVKAIDAYELKVGSDSSAKFLYERMWSARIAVAHTPK